MKKDKYFVFKSISLSLAMFFMIIIGLMFLGDSPRVSSIETLKEEKESNANVEGNRIIFNSGSNTMYGVKTKEITKRIGIPTYNLAINAGLDIEYIILQSQSILRPGDIIILPLEYMMFDNETYGEHAFEYYMVHQKKDLLKHSLKRNIKYFFAYSPYDRFADTFNAKSIKLGIFKYPNRLNDHGDMEGNIGNNFKTENASPLPIQPFKKETAGLALIKEFRDWCEKKDILLIVTYPNAIDLMEYKNNPNYVQYFASLEKYFMDNNIETIGHPEDSFLEEEYFYNTHYHLNQKGMTVRTNNMINLLLKNEEFVSRVDEIRTELSAKK